MDASRNNAKVMVGLVMFLALAGITLWAFAGDLEPSAPPAPTMKTLDQIYQAASAGILEREGFCRKFDISASGTSDIITVPAGKRFVLLRLNSTHISNGKWEMQCDTFHFDNIITLFQRNDAGGGTDYRYVTDFPDRCLVINSEDSLSVTNTSTNNLSITITGYFFNAP